ncbi:MAG: TerB family tellurite resistance protein [Proteobacteria bacterium]|nr:TerB family tellurite resistance protein [Pseudomonadota bacterium]
MIDRLLNRLENLFDGGLSSQEASRDDQIPLATAALLLEVARSDTAIDADELARIESLLTSVFPLQADAIQDLVTAARTEVEHATDLFQFTQIVNDRLSYKEKMLLVRQMWEVAYADGNIASYEDHIIRRVAGLLHVSHEDFIRAKIEARPA